MTRSEAPRGGAEPWDTDLSPLRNGWGLLGVPSSAAAHWPGVERGPRVLRDAGLLRELRSAGIGIHDHGDLPVARWHAAPTSTGVNNVDGVRTGLIRARDRVQEILKEGFRPLVLGGECTLAIAVVSAFIDMGCDVGLVYVDGGQDLMIPADHPGEPILDGMGVAHMLDLPGTESAIASIGPRRPLLQADQVVFLGYADEEEDVHGWVESARIPATDVVDAPESAARRALSVLDTADIVVHLDVDVLDFLLVPAADVPVYGRGLDLDSLGRVMRILLADPRCRGLLMVEYNPDHDPRRAAAGELIALLKSALTLT